MPLIAYTEEITKHSKGRLARDGLVSKLHIVSSWKKGIYTRCTKDALKVESAEQWLLPDKDRIQRLKVHTTWKCWVFSARDRCSIETVVVLPWFGQDCPVW